MLDQFRERAGRWVVGIILALLILSFSLWGIGSYFQPSGNAAVARVGEQEIGLTELQRAMQAETDRYRELLGDSYRPGMIDQSLVREQALRREVDRRLVEHDAHERALAVGDDALARFITGNEAFQGSSGFDQQRYLDLLRARGMSVAEFENQMRAALLTEQIERGVAQSAFVTAGEVDALARLWFETRDLRVATLAREQYLPAENPTDEAVQAYYSAHASEFQTPERVRVAYLLLDPTAVAAEVTITDADIKADYQARLAEYTRPERRAVRHILRAVPSDAAPEAAEAARAQAAAITAKLRGGAEFAGLARSDSQDAGSARQGGALGTYTRGTLDAALDEAAFALEPGTVSDPVRSDFGWHVLTAEVVQTGQVQPLGAVRTAIAERLRQERAQELVRARAEDLGRLAFEHPDSLDPAAQATGLPVLRTEMFVRGGGQDLAGVPAFNAAAFSDAVLTEGLNSEPIDLGDGRYAVLRLDEHEAAAPIALDTVRAEIVTRLNAEAAAGAARAAGEAYLEALTAGSAPDALTGSGPKPEWTTLAAVPREGRGGIPAEIVERAFSLPRPRDGKVGYAGVPLASGDYALVGVTAAQTDPRSADAGQRGQLREALVQLRRQSALGGYLATLRARTKVHIYPQAAE